MTMGLATACARIELRGARDLHPWQESTCDLWRRNALSTAKDKRADRGDPLNLHGGSVCSELSYIRRSDDDGTRTHNRLLDREVLYTIELRHQDEG